jgi:polyhydroxyalkanoate synthesis repressor PhaR
MPQPRIIKKYPNRRLYDTTESRYITLEDVKHLVLKSEPFIVIDKGTGEDITRTILLQIIIEQEEGGQPIFSTEILKRFIHLYGDSVQGVASRFLDESMDIFRQQQDAYQQRVSEALSLNPLSLNPWSGPLSNLTERNLKLWQDMQEQILKAALPIPPRTGNGSNPTPNPNPNHNEPDPIGHEPDPKAP